MRAPGFWSRPPGLRAALLSPLGALYAAGTARRLRRGMAWRAPVPVISVGNLTAGGTGKTPLVIALIERLSARGVTPHVLTRGYGGAARRTPHRVRPEDTAAEVGDEPLLISPFAPVWVCPDRAAAARAAIAAGAEALILDDAHQNPALDKDLSLVVVDARAGFGNGRVLPAGPLREPVRTGLGRADHLILVGPADKIAERLRADPILAEQPHTATEITPLQTGMAWSGLRVFAFAGIGQPEKFFHSLRSVGAKVVGTRAFGDHETYSTAILARLRQEAKAHRAQLVTTEKDAARLTPAQRKGVLTLPVRMVSEDWSRLDETIDRLFVQPSAAPSDGRSAIN